MARDRQRAKQRKARRAARNPGPAPSEPHRENVPGPLEHASGQVDEFEAALVSGAGGETADADRDRTNDADEGEPQAEREPRAADEAAADEGDQEVLDEQEVLEDEDELDYEDEDEESDLATAPARTPAAATRAEAPTARGPGRFLAFIRASWAELQRVQWPDRRQVAQATAVVLGFVVVAGVYLGVADRIAQEVVDLII